MSKRRLGLLALFLTAFFWGVGPVITKLGLQEIPPFTFVFLRLILGLFIILPVFFIMKHHKISKADLPRILMVGIFGSGLNGIFFISGISQTTATTASAIFATVPLVNSIAAAVILKEKPTWIRIVGVIIGLIGSFIITLGPNVFRGNGISGDIWGNLLIIGAVFSWVAYIVTSKELLVKYSPITITTYSFLVGATMFSPLSCFEFLSSPNWYLKMTSLGVIGIIYGAVFAGVLALVLFQWGMKQTSAFAAGVSTYLQPVLTVIFAILILGEKPAPVFILGTGLILGGVFLATTYEMVQKRRNSI